jgi:type VI secretion system protein ImpI
MMELILDVVKSGKNRPVQKSFRFDSGGGYIGRSEQANYRLTDPQNYISSRHASIEFKHGQFYLRDESTNGTFLKHPYKKLPKGAPHAVKASEVFIIGDHELQARINQDDYSEDFIIGGGLSEPAPLSAVEELIPDDDFLMDTPESAFESEEAPEAGIGLEPEMPKKEAEDKLDVLDLLGDRTPPMAAMETPEPEPEPQTEELPAQQPFEEYIDVPSYAEVPETPRPEPRENRGYEGSFAASLQVLEKRLGIEIVNLGNEERDALMAALGDVVVNALEGLRGSLKLKDQVKQDLRLPLFQNEHEESNPVKLGKSASQLLQNEMIGGRLGMMDLATAVNKSFAELDAHSVALHGASKNLMGIAASRFAPKSLEYKFESMGALKGAMPRACQLWKAYVQMAEQLNDDPDSGAEMLAPQFGKEYEKLAFTVGLASVNAHRR